MWCQGSFALLRCFVLDSHFCPCHCVCFALMCAQHCRGVFILAFSYKVQCSHNSRSFCVNIADVRYNYFFVLSKCDRHIILLFDINGKLLKGLICLSQPSFWSLGVNIWIWASGVWHLSCEQRTFVEAKHKQKPLTCLPAHQYWGHIETLTNKDVFTNDILSANQMSWYIYQMYQDLHKMLQDICEIYRI